MYSWNRAAHIYALYVTETRTALKKKKNDKNKMLENKKCKTMDRKHLISRSSILAQDHF